MKAIPTSVKAQFFAMYYWQQVLCTKSEKFIPVYLTAQTLEFRVLNDFDTDYLQLRNITDLSDEEKAMLRTKILCIPDSCELKLRKKGDFIVYRANGEYIPTYAEVGLIAHDYLRSIGILLSFTYLNEDKKPVTLSVDELIGMNWAQLTPKAK